MKENKHFSITVVKLDLLAIIFPTLIKHGDKAWDVLLAVNNENEEYDCT